MKKAMKIGLICLVGLFFLSLSEQKQMLRRELIRLHVVAASDSTEDQQVKLRVRDAVTAYLQENMGAGITSAREAKTWLGAHLGELEDLANEVLRAGGFEERAQVTLEQEAFPIRCYDTFTLPSGIYESLRIRIGPGAGQNWWCVVFPRLCLPATSEGFAQEAVEAGMGQSLANTLTGEMGYSFRFFLLDCLGQWEIFFREGN